MTEAYDKLCFDIYEGMKTLGIEKDFDYYYNNAPIFLLDLSADLQVCEVEGTALKYTAEINKNFMSFRNATTLHELGLAAKIVINSEYAFALNSISSEIYRYIHE